MNTSLFSTIKITKNRLDLWIKFNYNVMLIGEKGSGKSTQIIDAFNRNKLNWIYFSGATLDPWTDVVGIPKPKTLENGETVIEYIRPQNMNDTVEAIFVDEFNRTHKKVKNALMELIQFKSINGKKFPNLKIVWAAINPEDENETYDIEPVDPAQLDRFHIIANIPYEPDKEYFSERYGKLIGNQAIIWWKMQSSEIKKLISPRRLDYCLTAYNDGVDISDILPRIANITKLKEMINMSETEIEFVSAHERGDTDTLGKILNNNSSFEEIKKFVLSDQKYYVPISNFMHNEKISALYEENNKFKQWVLSNPTVGANTKILEEKNDVYTSKTESKVMDKIREISDIDPKNQLIIWCSDFVSRFKINKISIAEKIISIKLKFIPHWMEFINYGTELTLSDFNTIIDYLHILYVKDNNIPTEQIKIMKDVVRYLVLYTKQLNKGIITDDDSVSNAALITNNRLVGVFEKVFNKNATGVFLHNIPSL